MKPLNYTSEHIKAILAILVVSASFAYYFVTYFVGKSQSDPQIIIAIVGSNTIVLQYFFGSSQGSSKKDDAINKVLGNPSQHVDEINTDAINVKVK